MATTISCDFCKEVKPNSALPDYNVPVENRWVSINFSVTGGSHHSKRLDCCPPCARDVLKMKINENKQLTVTDSILDLIQEEIANREG